MQEKLRALAKLLLANRALKRLVISVNVNVVTQICLGHKGLCAEVAGESLDSQVVALNMAIEIEPRGVGLVAVRIGACKLSIGVAHFLIYKVTVR